MPTSDQSPRTGAAVALALDQIRGRFPTCLVSTQEWKKQIQTLRAGHESYSEFLVLNKMLTRILLLVKTNSSNIIQMKQWYLEAHWWRWLPLWKINSYRIYVAQTVATCKECSIKFPTFTLLILRMKWIWKGKIPALSKDSKHVGASDGWTEVTVKQASGTRKTLHFPVIMIPYDISNDSLKKSC